MDFETYARRSQHLYQEWLASQDEVAFAQSLEAGYQALEGLPAGRLTPAQQRQWDNLAEIYQRVRGGSWHPEHRQGWAQEVQELLRQVRP